MKGLCCGIDIGSTNIKVLLMDSAGRTVWVWSSLSPRINDGLGPVTDGKSLVAALESMILSGWREVGRGVPLAAIASAGIGEDGFCLDAQMRPMAAAIPWFDKRDRAEVAELLACAAAQDYPVINFAFATAAAKWLWLALHKPQDFNRSSCWIALTDYPLAWWSQTPFISHTLLPRTGVFDVFTRQVVPALCEIAHAPVLPEMALAGKVIGTVAAGPLRESGAADANTLCVAGGHDHPVASSVVLRIDPTARIDSMGTANAIYGETTEILAQAATAGIDLSLPIRGGAGISALGPIEFTVPLVKAFGTEQAVRGLLKDLPSHEKMIRLLTDLTNEAKHFLERMARVGVKPGPIYATGGWARSHALLQLRADIYGQPITAIHEPELTALGAALFAAEAAWGKVPDYMSHRETELIRPRP